MSCFGSTCVWLPPYSFVAVSLQVRSRQKRGKVQAAYDYLMTKEAESSYRSLVQKHNKFLRKQPDASDLERRRPLQFIETPGVECGLWPTLYWRHDICETVERATDSRRHRQRYVEALSDDEEDAVPEERHSVKRSFMRKVFGPIIGYSQDFELLQFVYDLTMWSRIGGGKNACAGLPLRLVLKGETFSSLLEDQTPGADRHAATVWFPKPFQNNGAVGVLLSLPRGRVG